MIKKILTFLILAVLVSILGFYMYIKAKAPEKGDKAPNFTATLTDGTDFQLSDLEGGYVLLDFWGSWCRPCREQNKELVRFYNENKTNITIVSVALEKNNDNWKRAASHDGLTWKHQIVEVGQFVMMSDIAQEYGVTAIPTKILISPDGFIYGDLTFDEIEVLISD